MNKSILLSVLSILTLNANANTNIINGVEFKNENNLTYSRVISITKNEIDLKEPTEYELITTENFDKIVPVFNSKYSYIAMSKNNAEIFAKDKSTNEWINLNVENPVDLFSSYKGNITFLTTSGIVELNNDQKHTKEFSDNFIELLNIKNLSIYDAKLSIYTEDFINNIIMLSFGNKDNFYDINLPYIFDKSLSVEEIEKKTNLHGYDRSSYSCTTGMSKNEILELKKTIKINNESKTVTDYLTWNIDQDIASNLTNDNQKVETNVSYELPLRFYLDCPRLGIPTKIVENDKMIGVLFADYLWSGNSRELSYFANFYDKTFSNKVFAQQVPSVIDLKIFDDNKFLLRKKNEEELIFNFEDLISK